MDKAEDVPVITFLREQLAAARDQVEATESALAGEREAHAATLLALREQERLALSLDADLKAARAELARLRRSVAASEKARGRIQKDLNDRKRKAQEQAGLVKELRTRIRGLEAEVRRGTASNGYQGGRIGLRLPWGSGAGADPPPRPHH